jgi:hypothetical protein
MNQSEYDSRIFEINPSVNEEDDLFDIHSSILPPRADLKLKFDISDPYDSESDDDEVNPSSLSIFSLKSVDQDNENEEQEYGFFDLEDSPVTDPLESNRSASSE